MAGENVCLLTDPNAPDGKAGLIPASEDDFCRHVRPGEEGRKPFTRLPEISRDDGQDSLSVFIECTPEQYAHFEAEDPQYCGRKVNLPRLIEELQSSRVVTVPMHFQARSEEPAS